MPSRSTTFRFYAELNDLLPRLRRFVDFVHEFQGSPSVKDVIESLGVPHTEVEVILVNGQPQGFQYRLQDGDRVSVYPMFEALDVGEAARVRAWPLRQPRFVLDVHLGKLAAYLRLLGLDATYDREMQDPDLARLSASEQRILLTRDRQLLKRSQVTHAHLVRSLEPKTQCVEVVRRFDLVGLAAPFTRCLRCNAQLGRVRTNEVAERIHAWVRAQASEVTRCDACDRLYWRGTHFDRLERLAREILDSAAHT
ncbi:MAG: twitching motility protein PilT [Chloroflexi bacterium]|nr:twitching motility protein PilT [Chloroflexota bacterium]